MYFFILYLVSIHFCVALLLLRTFVAFINKIIVIVIVNILDCCETRFVFCPPTAERRLTSCSPNQTRKPS